MGYGILYHSPFKEKGQMKLSWKKEKISDMVKIRVFIPHLELKEIFEDVVKKLPQYETIQIEQQYVFGTPDDLAKYGDADVLVARGMTYEVLKNLFPDKHVIEVHVSSFDIFDALVECRKQNAGKIALCLHNRKFKSMEELLPLIEREGIRVEIQSHPYDFCELNNETCDMVKSFRSPNLGYVYSSPHGFFYDEGKGDVRSMLKYVGDELTHVLFADTFNQTMDCRYILNPPWLNGRGKADVTVHQHLAMGEGDVDFDGIFETLRDMDFANKQLRADAPKAGGDNIACVSMFGFPEKMDRQAPEARERIERELLK